MGEYSFPGYNVRKGGARTVEDGLVRMHGSCTCGDRHAEDVRLMMTSPRIGFNGTATLAANTHKGPSARLTPTP